MKNYKIYDCKYDNGKTEIIIDTYLGKFLGVSKCHPDDMDYLSNIEGGLYAEWRAVIKFFKAEIRDKKRQLKVLENIIAEMQALTGYNRESREARFIRKKYYIMKKTIENDTESLKKLQEQLDDRMKNHIENRKKFQEQIKAKHEKTAE